MRMRLLFLCSITLFISVYLPSSISAQSINREIWANISGTSVASIPVTAAPASVEALLSLEEPSNVGDNFGTRLRGYITAPSNGSFTFWIAGDDNCELWLSTDEYPSKKVKIASVTGWTNSREWNKYTSQKSSDIALISGKKYYVEVLHKEGMGGDNCAVGWLKPGQSGTVPSEIVPQSVLSPYGGFIVREAWTNVSGTSVASIPLSLTPSVTSTLGIMEAPINWADNYGTRLRGYIVAPASGCYTFWISSDDNSELWLSTNDQPSSKAKIAYINGWTNSKEWNKFASQKSASINLTAGQWYYIEVLHKKGSGGGDNCAVGWARPGQSTTSPSELVPGSALSPFTSSTSSNLPTISIVYPDNGLSVSDPRNDTVPVNMLLGATASDPDGAINSVRFYSNGTLLGQATLNNNVYEYLWNNVPVGSYTITAQATNSRDLTTISSPITVTVKPKRNRPPQMGQIYFIRNNPVSDVVGNFSLYATATDVDGSISKVEFYAGTKLIGTAPTSIGNNQYMTQWNSVRPGNYTLGAVAYDNAGEKTGSGICGGSPPGYSYITNSNFDITLARGYMTYDIGATEDIGLYGYGTYDESLKTFTVRGACQPAAGTADAMQYTYTPMIGDGEYIARIDNASGLSAGARIGLMVRAGRDSAAQFAAIILTGNTLQYNYRTQKGTALSTTGISGAYSFPLWLKIARSGSLVSVYKSSDGMSWGSALASSDVSMPENALCGMTVCNNSKTLLASVSFSNVSLTVPAPVCNNVHNGCITRKVVFLNYDPIFKTRGNKPMHTVYNLMDPLQMGQAVFNDIAAASNNHVKFEIKTFPFIPANIQEIAGVNYDGYRFDESEYDYFYKTRPTDSLVNKYYFDYLSEFRKYKIDSLVDVGAIDEVYVVRVTGVQTYETQMNGPTAYGINGQQIFLPTIKNFPTVTISFERDIGIHYDGYYHRFEHIMDRVFGPRNADPYNPNMYPNRGTIGHLWDAFMTVKGAAPDGIGGCGCSHYSPNGEAIDQGYITYKLTNGFYSRCADWKNNYPNLTGTAMYYPIAKDAWGPADYSPEDRYRYGFFKNWLWPSIPNKDGRYVDRNNPINNGKLNNWWEYMFNFDKYPESR